MGCKNIVTRRTITCKELARRACSACQFPSGWNLSQSCTAQVGLDNRKHWRAAAALFFAQAETDTKSDSRLVKHRRATAAHGKLQARYCSGNDPVFLGHHQASSSNRRRCHRERCPCWEVAGLSSRLSSLTSSAPNVLLHTK